MLVALPFVLGVVLAVTAVPDTGEPPQAYPLPQLPPPVDPTPPAPAPYSLPWQLRPILIATVLRSDSSLALYEDSGGRPGRTIASGVTASLKIPGTGAAGAGLMLVARMMVVGDTPPHTPPPPVPPSGGLAVVNPFLGAALGLKHGAFFHTNVSLGFTAPIGMGGGNTPDAGASNARLKGPNARALMDNALFSVNDFGVVPGLGVAFIGHGLTVQLDATLIQSFRVRGEEAQPESTKTNSTFALHVGYFFVPAFSVGADLRYQRWLNGPFSLETNPSAVDQWTAAVGPRFHIHAGPLWIHPGIAYWRGLDKPLAASTPNYNTFQLDVPFIF